MFTRLLLLLCALLLAGCATPYDSKPSLWGGQTGFSQSQIGPDRWQIEFVGNDLVSRETARKYVLKRAGELALARGYGWVEVMSLDIVRDAVRATPRRPQFGFDRYEPDTFMEQLHVEHRISALLILRLAHRQQGDEALSAAYLARIATD
ncbi:CC0125/CC1285 family lipoprotein [Aeromonas bivalvium]|uniref:CC0125/CC1285 family lipoprotein n=1 Tax=Aeromonas bivalvium TaxID=440079 RepID=UPI000DCFB602|nr:hypothetical protein [Aeromonas bivalvium]